MSSPNPANGWQKACPSEVGLAADTPTRLDRAVRDGRLPNLNAVVVARHGKPVLERYLTGVDERGGACCDRRVRRRRAA